MFLALTQRARCYLAKQQYNQARRDLDQLLTIDPENNETQVKFL
jgi:Tfp pilus assembly protein PilF